MTERIHVVCDPYCHRTKYDFYRHLVAECLERGFIFKQIVGAVRQRDEPHPPLPLANLYRVECEVEPVRKPVAQVDQGVEALPVHLL